jgi:hypothetical protein
VLDVFDEDAGMLCIYSRSHSVEVEVKNLTANLELNELSRVNLEEKAFCDSRCYFVISRMAKYSN